MKLYHYIILALVFLALQAACNSPQPQSALLTVVVRADGGEREVQVPAGATVQEALVKSGAEPGELDRVDPSPYTVLTRNTNVQLIRVREDFVIEQVVIPYEEKELRNESLPAGEEFSIQAGQNGLQELTTRRILEDGVEVSSSVVKSVIVKESVPQIKMIGVQKPFAPVMIPGRLVYLTDGDAWMMEGTTGNRVPVVTTGDLDGRIFSLSPDGAWLLYTRGSDEKDVINTLWATKLSGPSGQAGIAIDLKVKNIVHFAGWKPGSTYTIAYSTVEPRAAAPGWQANNDLSLLSMSSTGVVRSLPPELETNMGGNYGWWGMTFAWSPKGDRLVYSRPDSLGELTLGEGLLTPLLDIVPLQTRGDWAWVPGVSWGPDGNVLFTVTHALSPGTGTMEQSPLFDVTAVPFGGGAPVKLVTQAGMFAYPLASPGQSLKTGEFTYQIAYLQAIHPNQSENSRYFAMVIDRDGSNKHRLFPDEGSQGLDPLAQWGTWSPGALEDTGGLALALIYQGNLWVVDTTNGEAWQITGDNLLSRVDWR